MWTRCPRHVHEVAAKVRRTRPDHIVKRKREAEYGVVRPHPTFKDALGSIDEDTDLSIDEPPPNQQPPLARKGTGGDEPTPSSQQPPLDLGGAPSGSDPAPSGSKQWKGNEGERSPSSNQQPPRRKGLDEEENAAEGVSRVGEMSDYAKRKVALTRKAALAPATSHIRFRESFQKSGASAAVKAKFARLANGPESLARQMIQCI